MSIKKSKKKSAIFTCRLSVFLAVCCLFYLLFFKYSPPIPGLLAGLIGGGLMVILLYACGACTIISLVEAIQCWRLLLKAGRYAISETEAKRNLRLYIISLSFAVLGLLFLWLMFFVWFNLHSTKSICTDFSTWASP